jgi:D-amino-acid dehydrogenase
LNIYPVKGYSITFQNVAENDLPKVSLLDEDAKIVTSSFKGRFRVAGTAELAGWNHDIRYDRITPLLNWTRENTYVDTDMSERWACLRPMTPDMMPIVKKVDGLWINSGAGHLGWTLCMSLAKKVADNV